MTACTSMGSASASPIAMNNNPEPTAEHKERYYEIVRWAAERGMAITMHWGPDGTIEHLLGIFERVNREVPIAPLRWSIAHLNDASEATLKRMSALGIGWTVQDAMYFGGEDLVRRQGADAARRVPPVVTGHRLGVHIGGGTDAHRVASYNPFTSLQWFLDGKTVAGTPIRGPEETPDRLTALEFYTLGSAWFSFDDDVRGSLEVGKLADLAVLSAGLPHRAARRGRRHRVGVDAARRRSRLRGGAVRGARRLKGRAVATGTELTLRCRCGTVRGVARDVAPSTVNHCFCYCDDCQAFAHFLGRADEVLDPYGGTEITQMSQANVGFTAGADKVAAMRLTATGMIRWYASCCRTPIGNTMATSAMPFIGVIKAFIDAPSAALGPIRGRGFAKSAKGGPAAVPRDGLPEIVMIARVLAKVLRWRLRGDHKRSALRDAATGKPLAEPRVLGEAEREELRRRCAQWRA